MVRLAAGGRVKGRSKAGGVARVSSDGPAATQGLEVPLGQVNLPKYTNYIREEGRHLSTWAKLRDLFHDLVAGKMLWSMRKVTAEFSCS